VSINQAKTLGTRASIALAALIIVVGVVFWRPTASAGSNDFDMALESARAGKLDRAVELWSKVIQRNPRSYSALVNRGAAFRRSGYVFKAIMDWHEARKWSPLFAYGVYCSDYIVQASGDTSMLNFASPLELEPDHVASVLMAGTMYVELGHPAMAAELYRKAVDLTRNPMLKTYLEHLADNLESTSKK
jgi:tetratricopeptide (TPR) repeat protein